MNEITWTKRTLCEAINQRVDRGGFGGNEYIMPHEVTDEVLDQFQTIWERFKNDLVAREGELKKVYQAIIGGF